MIRLQHLSFHLSNKQYRLSNVSAIITVATFLTRLNENANRVTGTHYHSPVPSLPTIVSAISPAPNITYTKLLKSRRASELANRRRSGGRRRRVACRERDGDSSRDVHPRYRSRRPGNAAAITDIVAARNGGEWARVNFPWTPHHWWLRAVVSPTGRQLNVALRYGSTCCWSYSLTPCARLKHTRNVRVKCPCTVHLYVYPQMLGYTSYRYISQLWSFHDSCKILILQQFRVAEKRICVLTNFWSVWSWIKKVPGFFPKQLLCDFTKSFKK